jgi:hypothetical protein
MDPPIEKKKRGRKAKTELITDPPEPLVEKIPKKRGRKPKGGKVVACLPSEECTTETKMNVILHLKCNKQDVSSSYDAPSGLDNYQFTDNKICDLNYMVINNNLTDNNTNTKNIKSPIESSIETVTSEPMKNIWHKLEKLSTNLRLDNICDKKSACFFCTCDFDNVPIYIPKYELNGVFHVYGCFCSPECGCAYLMNERNIDTTMRFERYHLLNFLYCKIYNYTKNIKPAPSPFYLLEKYYGNLTIQEYRKLLKNERLLLVVDKPLIRALPELHEDTDDYLLSYEGIPSAASKYPLQRQAKIPSKNDILNEQFNIKN